MIADRLRALDLRLHRVPPVGAPQGSPAGLLPRHRPAGATALLLLGLLAGGCTSHAGYRAVADPLPRPHIEGSHVGSSHVEGPAAARVAARDQSPRTWDRRRREPEVGRIEDRGDYDVTRNARFAVTLEGSRALDELAGDDSRLWGAGLYLVPDEAPIGFYINTRFTTHTSGDPDFTDVFAFNAFGHDIVDEEVEAFVVNVGALKPLNDSVNLFLGLGFAATVIETELRDPGGIFAGGGSYFQRRRDDEEVNLNLGALITVDPVAVTVQWDTAFEVFSFGLGFTF